MCAFLLRYVLDPLLGEGEPFLLFLLAVAAASWTGGFWQGAVALALSLPLSTHFFILPLGEWAAMPPGQIAQISIFGLAGIAVVLLGEVARRHSRALERRVDALEAKTIELSDELTRATEMLSDISEIKRAEEECRRALAEKELLLKEIHHRVKNNLQVIVSLLSIQSDSITDPRGREVFNESQNRIHSMALVHELLYQSKDLARIDFGAYLEAIADDLLTAYGTRVPSVSLEISVEDVRLGIDPAIACGLIVNELISNCLKHAFPGGRKGRVRVSLHPFAGAKYRLSVSDDGIGFPSGKDYRELPTLGLQLVHSLTQQLRGSIDIRNGRGTEFVIIFPSRGGGE